jgi:hypothetical protein
VPKPSSSSLNYHSPEWIDERLYQTEMHNLQHFDMASKLCPMIETAVELTEGRITGVTSNHH